MDVLNHHQECKGVKDTTNTSHPWDTYHTVRNHTIYVRRGTIYVRRGTIYVHRGTIYVRRGTIYVHRGTIYVHRGTIYVSRGTNNMPKKEAYKSENEPKWTKVSNAKEEGESAVCGFSMPFMITIFPILTYLYGENELLWGPMCSFVVFSQEKTSPVSRELICNETLLQNYHCPL